MDHEIQTDMRNEQNNVSVMFFSTLQTLRISEKKFSEIVKRLMYLLSNILILLKRSRLYDIALYHLITLNIFTFTYPI